MSQPIPDTALDDRLFFGGTAGSGKTYNAMSRVERLLKRNSRVVIPDPLGVWWGLRLSADGKTESGFDVVIFGGPHGDLPLTEHAGALIGETVAGMKESCILDLSQLGTKAAERRFMLAFLTALYRHASGEPVHVVFDEADMWAPQKLFDKEGEAAKLLGMMETIVRRGRVKGFIPWLISQRPAVITKDILSQVDGMVAFKLTSSQDRKAIEAWVEGQADKKTWDAISAQLPMMKLGQGLVWIPGRGILDTVQFPEKLTFDSSRTPKRGEKLKRTADLKPIDLGTVKERLAAVEIEAKANDPRALKAELARVNRDLHQLRQDMARMPLSDPKAITDAEQRGYLNGIASGRQHIVHVVDDIRKDVERHYAKAQRLADKAFDEKMPLPKTPPMTNKRFMVALGGAHLPKPFTGRLPAKTDNSDRPLGAERKPLAALASTYPGGMTESQWRVAAGFKASGTWSTYRGRLVGAGRVELRGDQWFATEQGIADLGGEIPTMPAPGTERVQFWIGKISGVGPLLRRLAEIYPEWTSREQLAVDVGLVPTSGTYSTYLGRLKGPGLIETTKDKMVRASTELMDGA